MNHGGQLKRAFSLVEVVLALGILTFALLVIAALLPVGLKSNRVSVEDSNAANLLTLLEADLRNTHPSLNSGKSKIFGLVLPYKYSSGTIQINDGVQTNTLSAAYSTGIQEDGSPVVVTATPPPPYQASVIYTSLPNGTSQAPVEARIIIDWPVTSSTDVAQLTQGRNYLETFVTFPPP